MAELLFEDVFPIARTLARQKARKLIGCCGFISADLDDISSELLLAFYVAFSEFDSGRSSVRTFASRVMDKKLVSIFRYRKAQRRRHAFTAESVDEILDLHAERSAPTTIQVREFWSDVDRALAWSSKPMVETVIALRGQSVAELTGSLHRSRSAIHNRIRRLRDLLQTAGIDASYFRS